MLPAGIACEGATADSASARLKSRSFPAWQRVDELGRGRFLRADSDGLSILDLDHDWHRLDVVVTDGFTGNIAMKASEGTAAFVRASLKEAFGHSILSRFGSLFALTSLRRLRMRIDPRRANGGVFLGLNGAVVKSHGGANYKGVANAIAVAASMVRNDITRKIGEDLDNFRAHAFNGEAAE